MTDTVPTKKPIVPLTKIRIQVPKGVKIEDIVSNLQLSFEEVTQTGAEFNSNHCCVDVAVVGPFSTVSNR